MSIERTKTLIPMETIVGVINLTIDGTTRTFQIYYGGALNPWLDDNNMLIAPNDLYEKKLKEFFENEGQEYIIPSKTEIASVCAEVKNNYVKGLYHNKEDKNIVNSVNISFEEAKTFEESTQHIEKEVEPDKDNQEMKTIPVEENVITNEYETIDENVSDEKIETNNSKDEITNTTNNTEESPLEEVESQIEPNKEDETSLASIKELEEIVKNTVEVESTEEEIKNIQEETKVIVKEDSKQIEELKEIISNQNVMIASLNETINKQNESIAKINENIELLKKKNKGSIGSNAQKKTYIAVLLSTIVIIIVIALSQMYLPKMESAIKLENNTDAEVHIVIHNKDGSDSFERVGSISVQNGKIVVNNKN